MDAHEEPSEWRCDFCGAGPFTYDVGSGGWDEHWRSCEKNPRPFEERAAALGIRQTFPADEMNRIVEVTTPRGIPLFCPHCGVRHVDEGEWETRSHHTHLCAACGLEWRVEPYCYGAWDLQDDDEDDGLDEEQVQAIALALAELSLRRPGWLEHLRGIASHYDAHLLFEQFRASSAGAVPEAPDSPLVSRVEELTREVLRLKNKCANYATYANHLEGCKAAVIDRGNCDCGLLEVLCDVNVHLELPPPKPKTEGV